MKTTPYSFNRLEAVAYAKGYRVTKDGRLLNPKGRPISANVGNGGYPRFRYATASNQVFAHRLAAFQKFGDAIYQPDIVCRHLDNNCQNFRPDNIAIGTQHDNVMDRTEESRKTQAAIATAAWQKYDHKDVVECYSHAGSREVVSKFGMSRSMLHYILNHSNYVKQRRKAA